MKDVELEVADSFERVFPVPVVDAAWDDVLARAGVARVAGPQQTTTSWLPRWRWRRVILAFALVVVGVVVTLPPLPKLVSSVPFAW